MKIISLKLILVAFLIALFQYPQNIYLQKFIIAVYLYVFLCVVAAIISIMMFLFGHISKETRTKIVRSGSIFLDIIEIITAILFILNDMHVCFIAYSISILIGTLIYLVYKDKEE